MWHKSPTSELAGARDADAEAAVAPAAALIQPRLCCLPGSRALCQQLSCFFSSPHLRIIITRLWQIVSIACLE